MLDRYIRAVDRLNEAVGRLVSWFTVILVLIVCLNVALRYIAGHSLLALQDLSWYLFGAIFFLGAAFAYRHDRHVRVDVLASRLDERKRAWIEMAGIVTLLIPFCILGVVVSLDFVANAYRILESSPDPGGLPYRFIPKAYIPAGFTLLGLQATAELARRIQALRAR